MFTKYNDFVNEGIFSNIFKSKKKEDIKPDIIYIEPEDFQEEEEEEEEEIKSFGDEEIYTDKRPLRIRKPKYTNNSKYNSKYSGNAKDIDNYSIIQWKDDVFGDPYRKYNRIYIDDMTSEQIKEIVHKNEDFFKDLIDKYQKSFDKEIKDSINSEFYKKLIENGISPSNFSKTWLDKNFRKNTSLLF